MRATILAIATLLQVASAKERRINVQRKRSGSSIHHHKSSERRHQKGRDLSQAEHYDPYIGMGGLDSRQRALDGHGADEAPGTIVDIAVRNPEFSTLVQVVTAAGLADTLSGDGPLTVFGKKL